MRSLLRRSLSAALFATALVSTALVAAPARAVVPDGVSGPVIYDEGIWYIRTTPTNGPANLKFSYGRRGAFGDLPVVGDWDGNGSETVGIARITGEFPQVFQWHLRNTNSGGSADVVFEFGVPTATDYLRGRPIVGNFDPADDAYEVGYVIADANGRLRWTIRRDLTPTSPEVTFFYGSADDGAIVGDWDGDGVDSAGVRRGNRWLLTNTPLQGGTAALNFSYGTTNRALFELAIVGDWNGDGVDTPGVLRNEPPTDIGGGYETWLVTNRNTTGTAEARFTYGSDAFALRDQQQSDLFFLPRLTIEVT